MKNNTNEPARPLAGIRSIANTAIAVCLTIAPIVQAQTWDLSDYSEYSTGYQYTPEYPDQTKPINYPEFSWDKVPRWLAFRGPDEMTAENVESIADHYQVVLIEKQNKQGLSTNEEGTIYSAQQLKAFNPNIHCYFYWNSWIEYGGYAASDEFEANADEWAEKNEDGSIYWFKDLYMTYDYSSPGMRQWWIDTAVEMASNPYIDGVFADKVHGQDGLFFDESGQPASDYIDMLDTLGMLIPSDKTFIGNALRNERPGGNREHMVYFDASYFERWEMWNRDVSPTQPVAEAIAVSIQLAREALSKGKIVTLQSGPPDGYASTQQHLADNVDFPLAVFLIMAEEHAYFSYQGGVADTPAYEDWLWNTDWIDEFNHPLGQPFGPPERDGYVYTRSFEYVDVYVDVETHEATLTWYDDPRPLPTDTTPPTPNPAGFSTAPVAISSSAITMTAITGSDSSGPVEYRFIEQSGNPGATSSGWQTSPTYTDDGLDPQTQYQYVLRMRDSENNVGATSSSATATTFSEADTTPPSPDPAGFSTAPIAISSSAITMTAITGSDPSGPVEYRFIEQSGNPGATSSNWQTSSTYTDDGLSPETQYQYVVRMRDSLGNIGVSSNPATTTTFSSGGMTSLDVGATSASGSSSQNGGTYTINGSGADIWGTADAFHFVNETLDGDGEIVARVTSVENTNAWAKVGVMIRETLDAGSPHAMTVVTPSKGVSFQRRTNANGGSAHTTISGISAPQWLRITRSGNTFTSAYSSNGSSWTTIGSATVNMGSSTYIGMVVTSHVDGTLCTAVMDNVSISGGESPSNPDLVGHWSLDDGSGSIAMDTSGNGNHATVSNASWVNGTNGGALDFNGASSQVTIPNSAFDEIESEMTIAMWVNGDDTQPRNDTLFFAADASGNRALNIHLPWSNSNVYWDAGYSSGYDRIQKTATPSEFMGQWNHWVFTKNATTGNMAIYLNGSLWHSGTDKTKTIPSIAAASIGSNTTASNYDGMIDDITLFKAELTAQEVLDLYNSY